jgi:ABC-2 type transport system permease protein
MTLAAVLDKTWAIARRDVLTAVRYRAGFLTTSLGVVFELAAFYFLSHAIGQNFRPDGIAYFPFLLVGTGFYTFLIMGIQAFLNTVQQAQQTGTLEVLLTTSTPAPLLVLLSAASAFASNALRLVLYFALGLGITAGTLPSHPNFGGGTLILLLSAIIAVAIGILAAACQIAMQRGSAVLWLFGSLAWLMTGTLFPVSTLPQPLWTLAQWVPFTHSLYGMRLALLQGASFAMLERPIAILGLFCVALVPFSLWVFAYTVRRARIAGTLSFY